VWWDKEWEKQQVREEEIFCSVEGIYWRGKSPPNVVTAGKEHTPE
jgi:hypothetical protein